MAESTGVVNSPPVNTRFVSDASLYHLNTGPTTVVVHASNAAVFPLQVTAGEAFISLAVALGNTVTVTAFAVAAELAQTPTPLTVT
ncbi:hypothetical protein D3C72_418760 [compost metagenome]